MQRTFTFSDVNSIKDLAKLKQSCIMQKCIQNQMKKQRPPEPIKIPSERQKDISKTNILLNQKRSSQQVLKKFELRTHRLTRSEISLNSILVKKSDTSCLNSPCGTGSLSKKVSFKNLVEVINDGVKKREKLIEKESKLRSGYFFNSNQIRNQ